jgi:hypothetical protein
MEIGIRPLLAVMAVALLGAGCDAVPDTRPDAQPAGLTAPDTTVANAHAATINPGSDDEEVECETEVATGTMMPKKFCISASQKKLNQESAQDMMNAAKPR